jgi:hypothetical protein
MMVLVVVLDEEARERERELKEDPGETSSMQRGPPVGDEKASTPAHLQPSTGVGPSGSSITCDASDVRLKGYE